MTDTPSTPANGNSNPQFLVLLATKTPEKIIQYQAIFRAMGLPVAVRSLDSISVFHSAVEDKGIQQENAKQKFDEIKNEIERCRESGSPQNKALVKTCNELHVPFNPDNIIFMTEDSSMTLPAPIWKILRKKLANDVPEELLKSADNNGHDKISIDDIFTAKGIAKLSGLARKRLAKLVPGAAKNGDNSKQGGPGAEIGPILAAVGVERFFKKLDESVHEAKIYENRDIPITQLATFVFSRLSSPSQAPPKMVSAEVPVYLHAPDGLGASYKEPESPIVMTGHFLHGHKNPKDSIASNLDEYLPDPDQSYRGQMVVKFWTALNPNSPPPLAKPATDLPAQADQPLSNEARKRLKRKLRNLKITAIGAPQAPVTKLGSFQISSSAANDNEKPANPALAAISMDAEFRKSDAFVFLPFDPTDDAARLRNTYRLLSVLVAKQTDPRESDKPIVIMDDGSWTPVTKAVFGLVDAGMSKDVILTPGLEGRDPKNPIVTTPDVQHIATGYLDIVKYPNKKLLELAAEEVLKVRLPAYHRFHSYDKRQDNTLSGGSFSGKPAWTEAIFTSASSDNLRLNMDLATYARHKARQGDGIVWGGGDRHAMGTVYEAYKGLEGPWIAGFSTPLIIKAETKFGRMPSGCDYWEINPEIFTRMLHMVRTADVINVFPGGCGTGQELLAAMVLKQFMPDKMKGKSIVIHSPDLHANSNHSNEPFWDVAAPALLGQNFWNAISKNHNAFATEGIYLTTSMSEHMVLTNKLKREGLAARSTTARQKVALG